MTHATESPAIVGGWPDDQLRRYMAAVCFRLARYYGFADRADHADLMQDAVVELARTAPKFDPDRGTSRVFATFAVRRTVQRARLRRDARPFCDPMHTVPVCEAVADQVIDPAQPDPHDEAERRMTAGAVRAAVAALPDRERRVVTRRFGLDGRPPATLANALPGASEWTAADLIGRAVARLRLALGAEGGAA